MLYIYQNKKNKMYYMLYDIMSTKYIQDKIKRNIVYKINIKIKGKR